MTDINIVLTKEMNMKFIRVGLHQSLPGLDYYHGNKKPGPQMFFVFPNDEVTSPQGSGVSDLIKEKIAVNKLRKLIEVIGSEDGSTVTVKLKGNLTNEFDDGDYEDLNLFLRRTGKSKIIFECKKPSNDSFTIGENAFAFLVVKNLGFKKGVEPRELVIKDPDQSTSSRASFYRSITIQSTLSELGKQ